MSPPRAALLNVCVTSHIANMDLELSYGDIAGLRGDAYYPLSGRQSIDLTGSGCVVVLTLLDPPYDNAHPEVRVAPLTFRVDMATDLDLVCPAESGPFGRAFVVEVWNQRAMLVENLVGVIGTLDDAARRHLATLHNVMLGLGEESELAPAWHGLHLVEDDDPRLAYQATRAEWAECLSASTDQLLQLRPSAVHGHLSVAWPEFVRACSQLEWKITVSTDLNRLRARAERSALRHGLTPADDTELFEASVRTYLFIGSVLRSAGPLRHEQWSLAWSAAREPQSAAHQARPSAKRSLFVEEWTPAEPAQHAVPVVVDDVLVGSA